MPERRLFLVRHGIAEDVSKSGRDADRELTAEGRHKTRRAARGLRALGVQPTALLASPLVRARETAEIIAGSLGCEPETWKALACGIDHERVTREIDGRFPGGSIVLVGHEPDLGELLSFWLTGSIEGFATHFRKGAVACVSGAQLPPQRRAVLEWLLTADQLGGLDAG
jgi:phosphohistidine phosphatase